MFSSSQTQAPISFKIGPNTLDELLNLPEHNLYKIDLARTNLLCASGMPTTESLGINHALAQLDQWAKRVAFETDRHLYRVTDPRFASRYQGSEPHFRAEMLAQVLQQDLGVHYNKNAVDNFSFADPAVAFIHGMIPRPDQPIADTPGGTCATMPVLYAAVGRRLGYPLKLATTHSHLFARWDGESLFNTSDGHKNPAWQETFNCETTHGFHKYEDKHYRNWPRPVTEQEVIRNGLLQSLTPAEELALSLAARGHHALDVGQPAFAAQCYGIACRYGPARPNYRDWFKDAALKSNYTPSDPALRKMIDTERGRLATQTQRRRAQPIGVPQPIHLNPITHQAMPTPIATATPAYQPNTLHPTPLPHNPF